MNPHQTEKILAEIQLKWGEWLEHGLSIDHVLLQMLIAEKQKTEYLERRLKGVSDCKCRTGIPRMARFAKK